MDGIMLDRYVSGPVFIASLAIGILFVYMSEPAQRVVHVYPTPELSEAILYRDRAGVCHKVTAQEVKCPSSGAKTFPVQQ